MSIPKPASNGARQVMKTKVKRKKIKTPPGHPSDDDLIAAYLANGGTVTKASAGRAEGSLYSSDWGLRGS